MRAGLPEAVLATAQGLACILRALTGLELGPVISEEGLSLPAGSLELSRVLTSSALWSCPGPPAGLQELSRVLALLDLWSCPRPPSPVISGAVQGPAPPPRATSGAAPGEL